MDTSERINIGRARFMIVVIILALIFLGARMGHRAWWLRKIVRDTEQEIVDVGFQLEKLEAPIGPQLEPPVTIDTLAQFLEEAESVGAETIYVLPGNYLSEGSSFYLGRKGMYHYSYELIIVPLTRTLFPKYVTPSEKQAIEIGRDFLEEKGYATGRILSSSLEEREPNFYWDYALKFERPDIQGLRSCWVIRFEQAERPGHWFEVWIDTSEQIVIGGMQCR